MKTDNTLLVEFDGDKNQSFLFQPLGRTVRGRFDAKRMANAGKLYHQWPESIPGQRLQLDIGTGEAEIVEPLWDTEFTPIRERIEERGWKLPPGRESCKVDPATAVYWLKPLVAQGKAKVLSGKLPEKIDGKPRTRFHSVEQPEAIDKLTAAIGEQNMLLANLLSKLADNK